MSDSTTTDTTIPAASTDRNASSPSPSSPWPSQILPTALQSQGLHFADQTPSSARALLSRGQLIAQDFIESSPEIERTLMEAFMEDDYEGQLHLTTLSIVPKQHQQQQQQQQQQSTAEEKEVVVGLAFWREIPCEEMSDWLDLHRIADTIAKHSISSSSSTLGGTTRLNDSSSLPLAPSEHSVAVPLKITNSAQQHPHHQQQQHDRDDDEGDLEYYLSNHGKRAMQLVRSNSLSWIRNAIVSNSNSYSNTNKNNSTNDDIAHNNNNNTTTNTNNNNTNMNNTNAITNNARINSINNSASYLSELTHSWIKIELIAIKKSYRSHHFGNILLGCTLSRAHDLYHKEHAVLHVAGGGLSSGDSGGATAAATGTAAAGNHANNDATTKNIPASKLYKRYGFVAVPKHDEGGVFHKPDRYLYVLGNIGKTLDHLPWDEMVRITNNSADDNSMTRQLPQLLQHEEEEMDLKDQGDGKRKAATQGDGMRGILDINNSCNNK